MLPTSARLLKLLSLLQAHREWSGSDLAQRLDIDVRTVRRDIAKLRQLGYPVNAAPGVAGGYQLGAGASMPPLLLDDEETIAVAMSLRTAAGTSISGVEESSMRALAKLEQVLPSRLRHRVNTLQSVTTSTATPSAPVDAETLTTVAVAARARERLRFDYRRHDGSESVRDAEPHRLVHNGSRWYLMAWDVERADWRNFRLDRMTPRIPTGPRFEAREVPEFDIDSFALWQSRVRYRARVTVHAPAEAISDRIDPRFAAIEPIDDNSCLLHAGSSWLDGLAMAILFLECDFEVHDPPELIEYFGTIAARLRAFGS